MPLVTIYGPQDWSSGTFSKPSAYKSTAVGGGDSPITGYPEVVLCEAVQTDSGSGPNGENALILDNGSGGAGVETVMFSNTVGDLTGSNQFGVGGVFDAGFILDGVYVEWDQYLSTSYLTTAGNYAMLLCLANGIDGVTAPCVEIELQETTHPDYEIWFGYRGISGGVFTMTQASGHRPVVGTITADNAWHRFKTWYKASTVSSGSYTDNVNPGVGTAVVQSDGELKIWVDGVLLDHLTGLSFTPNPWMAYNGQSQSPYAVSAVWHGITFAGPITNTHIYRITGTTERNLLTGNAHSVINGSSDNLVAGDGGTVDGASRVALFSLDEAIHTIDTDNTFAVYADQIILNGVTYASTADPPQLATVTFTDAQVKALPTTPITVVAAPGAGYALELIQARVTTGISSAYTNIDAAAYMVLRMSGGDEHSSYLVNDAGEGLSQVADLLTNAQSSATFTKFQTTVTPSAGWGALANYSGSAYENEGLQLFVDNGGSGDFTGGAAGNLFRVQVWYAVVAV